MLLLLPILFSLTFSADADSPTTTTAPDAGNSTGNETQPKPKPPIDVSKVAYFNLTDWIQDYPDETAELNQWKMHLLEESRKLYDQVTHNTNRRNHMYVETYEKLEETPIKLEKMEKHSVDKHDMVYEHGNVRHDIFKWYRDQNLYYSFEVFYEDMPGARIFVEPENLTADFYDWGTVYNQTVDGDYTILQKYQIYLRKWLSPEDAYATPNSIFIKEYKYNVTIEKYCITRGYYYKWQDCYYYRIGTVNDAKVEHFLNTGRLMKCACNCGYSEVVAPVLDQFIVKQAITTTQAPTTTTTAETTTVTTTAKPTVTTTLAPVQTTAVSYQKTTAAKPTTTTTSAPNQANTASPEVTSQTTRAPEATTTTATPDSAAHANETGELEKEMLHKTFTTSVHSTYVFSKEGKFNTYGDEFQFSLNLHSSDEEESSSDKMQSPIDLETLTMEPAKVRQVKFNHEVEIKEESVKEIAGNSHAAIGFSKTTAPMFNVDFEDVDFPVSYHGMEIYLNVTEAKEKLFEEKYKYHIEMYKVAVMDNVSPSGYKNLRRAVFIAKLSFYSNCEDNHCYNAHTTTEFFNNVGLLPIGLSITQMVVISILVSILVIAAGVFIFCCIKRKTKKIEEDKTSIQFDGEGVRVVDNQAGDGEEVRLVNELPTDSFENPMFAGENHDSVQEDEQNMVHENDSQA